jgi:hypothetical protein
VTDVEREDPAEAAAVAEALALAALPPPSDEERRAVDAGSAGVLRSWRHAAIRRRAVGVGISALAAAAAVAVFAASPWMLRRPLPAAAPVAVEWRFPDLDAAWEASALVDPDGAVTVAGALDEAPTDAFFAELAEVELDAQ